MKIFPDIGEILSRSIKKSWMLLHQWLIVVMYQKELEASQAVADFLTLIKPHPVITLLYASKEPVYNHARILRDYLEMRLRE